MKIGKWEKKVKATGIQVAVEPGVWASGLTKEQRGGKPPGDAYNFYWYGMNMAIGYLKGSGAREDMFKQVYRWWKEECCNCTRCTI